MKNDATEVSGKSARNRTRAWKPKPSSKMGFIVQKIHEQKWTARDIAKKVAAKFPDRLKGVNRINKALRFVRAVPWHMKKHGDETSYLPEHSAAHSE